MSLQQLDAFDFEKRVDTKFIFHEELLPALLQNLSTQMFLLEINGERIYDMYNTYFDSEDLAFYHAHQRGMANRMKIRIRSYGKKGLRFLEIKRKNNRKQTLKNRLRLHPGEGIKSKRAIDFLREFAGIHPALLKQTFENNFKRITLANSDFSEKFTLDFQLSTAHGEQESDFQNLAIAEIKQPKYTVMSPFFEAMRKQKIRPTNFSKYCFGVMRNMPSVKQNRFKTTARKLEKIENGTILT